MIIQILIGLLAFVFVTLLRMQSLKKDTEAAKQIFVPKKYFESEWMGMVASIISIVLWALLYPEVVVKYPAIEGFIRGSFFVMGGMGSWVLQMALGKTKDWIRSIVADKTTELHELKKSDCQDKVG